ncbi:hypothetical protein CVT24_004177 [Panaeolus cyanescens]|uniref:AIG1-type G domain-containing protein n=1 Tax=Panaeolus cyanescens TaxID=181874 RepID=A0A409W7W5_9AGAR|nr:hypothetical protein CVT24_004177 [Panaeolus cyanescens]
MQCKIILLIGATGSGKSNFLDHLTPPNAKKRAKESLSARSSTFEIAKIQHPEIPNTRLVIIDTPGWDDYTPTPSDIDKVMRGITLSYPLDAILFFHSISVNRAPPISTQTALAIKSLAHRKQSKRGTFVTTMWDTTNEERAYAREDTLRDRTWKEVIEQCSFTATRFHNTTESAWNIIDAIPARLMNYPSTSDLLLDVPPEQGCFGCFP